MTADVIQGYVPGGDRVLRARGGSVSRRTFRGTSSRLCRAASPQGPRPRCRCELGREPDQTAGGPRRADRSPIGPEVCGKNVRGLRRIGTVPLPATVLALPSPCAVRPRRRGRPRGDGGGAGADHGSGALAVGAWGRSPRLRIGAMGCVRHSGLRRAGTQKGCCTVEPSEDAPAPPRCTESARRRQRERRGGHHGRRRAVPDDAAAGHPDPRLPWPAPCPHGRIERGQRVPRPGTTR